VGPDVVWVGDQGFRATVSEACFTVPVGRMKEDGVSTMSRMTREQLLEQRERLLAKVRLTPEELRERAETYSLSADELDVWYELEGIDYLLEGDSDS
jgi:hypothetical protein